MALTSPSPQPMPSQAEADALVAAAEERRDAILALASECAASRACTIFVAR